VKNRFHNLPFKFNLQRYTAANSSLISSSDAAADGGAVHVDSP
jgi:hypothetical protein